MCCFTNIFPILAKTVQVIATFLSSQGLQGTKIVKAPHELFFFTIRHTMLMVQDSHLTMIPLINWPPPKLLLHTAEHLHHTNVLRHTGSKLHYEQYSPVHLKESCCIMWYLHPSMHRMHYKPVVLKHFSLGPLLRMTILPGPTWR